MGSVTIYHVAKAARVSPSTVSNVLNGRVDRMLPQTRRRVEHAMKRLDYRPNRTARRLRTGRVASIGLIVPSVANPFWGAFARHIEAAALAVGYHVLLCNSERDPERERSYVDELWAEGIRGIVLCTSLPSLAHLSDKLDDGLSLVAFDRTAQVGDPPQVVNISLDNAVGAQLATRHLLALGHRRFAFVSGSLKSINRRDRLRGFSEALRSEDLDPEQAQIWSGGNLSPDADLDAAGLGRAAATDLLAGDPQTRPTAIVAVNDMCALGICAGVRDAGLEVGRDVSVTGFDDIVLANLVYPALTTIRQPLEAMAEAAFDHVRRRIEGSPLTGESLLMRPELIVRQSTGPAPH